MLRDVSRCGGRRTESAGFEERGEREVPAGGFRRRNGYGRRRRAWRAASAAERDGAEAAGGSGTAGGSRTAGLSEMAGASGAAGGSRTAGSSETAGASGAAGGSAGTGGKAAVRSRGRFAGPSVPVKQRAPPERHRAPACGKADGPDFGGSSCRSEQENLPHGRRLGRRGGFEGKGSFRGRSGSRGRHTTVAGRFDRRLPVRPPPLPVGYCLRCRSGGRRNLLDEIGRNRRRMEEEDVFRSRVAEEDHAARQLASGPVENAGRTRSLPTRPSRA